MHILPPGLLELVMGFEGFSPTVYQDVAGYWTIGYGERCAPTHLPITQAEGEKRLELKLEKYMGATLSLSPGLFSAHPDRLAAITDFVYNLGGTQYRASTLRRRVNDGDWPGAAEQIVRWVYAGGKKQPGLIRRRAVEARMLLLAGD